MDVASCSVAMFLETLQDAQRQMDEVWEHYLRRGVQPKRSSLVLSGRPFTIQEGATVRKFHGSIALGLPVEGADGREYELLVDLLWDAKCWTIMTEVWVEAEPQGQDLLRELPARTAVGLRNCLKELSSAVGDLVGFEDLIPTEGSQTNSGK